MTPLDELEPLDDDELELEDELLLELDDEDDELELLDVPAAGRLSFLQPEIESTPTDNATKNTMR